MKQSLTLKYRPTEFKDVSGQGITATILKRIVELESYKNAYLFCGKSGCGKTTLARIFAMLINKGKGSPIEIDAASNSGVDNVRAIVDSANQRSMSGGEYKIIIIDECHAISSAGWQAFLKGIEEAPSYTIYIFCTTEPNKIPPTILNRVQRYNIAPISYDEIKERLVYICEQEGFTNYESGCEIISKSCNNGMRDAITLLEQCADYSHDISAENVKSVLGDLSYDILFNLAAATLSKNQAATLGILAKAEASGLDLKRLVEQFLLFTIDLAKYCHFEDIKITSIPAYLEPRCKAFKTNIKNAVGCANSLTESMLELKSLIRYDTSYKATIEAYFIKLTAAKGAQ